MKRFGNFACAITLSMLLVAGSALAGVTTPNPTPPPPPEVKVTGVTTPNPEPPPPSSIRLGTDQTAYQTSGSLSLFELVVIIMSNMGSNLL
ncbi:MAG TPA: hypothetical protein VE262_13150 [Blastocatellia bacterium]|nr:hypothetical protein [Blastocatellia bacterium]